MQISWLIDPPTDLVDARALQTHVSGSPAVLPTPPDYDELVDRILKHVDRIKGLINFRSGHRFAS